jgi:hypothetical protein
LRQFVGDGLGRAEAEALDDGSGVTDGLPDVLPLRPPPGDAGSLGLPAPGLDG